MEKALKIGLGQSKAEIVLEELPTSGRIPVWLEGTLIRNGPGTLQVGEERYRHWFDGLAMLHRFSFKEGKVSYANRFLETRAYREAMDSGRIAYSEFATDPCRSIFSRVMTIFDPKISDSAKVNVARMGDQYMALAETPIQVAFDPETLESVGVFNYEENLTGQMTTVHPHFDPITGEAFNLVTRYHRISHYRLYRIKKGREPELFSSIPVRKPAYIHSFGMTPNYFIIAEFPLVVNPLSLLLWLKPYIENFRWEPRRGTKFWLIDRRTGEVALQARTEAFFAFHHINAFEENGEVVLDLAVYPDPEIIHAFFIDRLEDEESELPAGNLRRYRIPLDGGTVRWKTVSESVMELPRFNDDAYLMHPGYRYVYASSIDPDRRGEFYNQILKVDIQTGEERTWSQAGHFPGEPVFVAAPDSTAEDDGVLLSVVLDEQRGASFLLVLDARNLEEIGRAELPHPVLFGYHGAYFHDLTHTPDEKEVEIEV